MLIEEPLIKSKLQYGTILLLLGLIVLFIYLSTLCFHYGMIERHIQLYPTVGGVLLAILSLFLLREIYKTKVVWIYADRMEIRDPSDELKRTISFSAIQYWYEEISVSRIGQRFYRLTVYSNDKSSSFYSGIFDDYDKVKQIVTHDKLENKSLALVNSAKRARKVGWTFISASIFLTLFYIQLFTGDRRNIKTTEITTISGQISEIQKRVYHGNGTSIYLYIQLKQFPEYIFRVQNGPAIGATNLEDLMANVASGDSIELDVLSKTVQKKLTHTLPIGFWDKYIDYDYIDIYGIRQLKQSYLSLADYEQRCQQMVIWPLYLLIAFFAFPFFFGGIYLLRKGRFSNAVPNSL